MRYPRDLAGYGPNPPHANWPGGANIAIQFVLNYEEGGENNVLHGDQASEAFLSDVVGAAPWPGARHWNIESMYEYGARAGFWRLHRLFTQARLPVTVYGVATALMRAPQQVQAMLDADWEIASHGYKWIEHKDMERQEEAAQIAQAVRLHTVATGSRPLGWYTGRCSVNTVDLVSEQGGFAYISDTYDDDLPYWRVHNAKPQLIIPYTLANNDMRFVTASGFANGEEFFQALKDSFDCLYREGAEGSPKMMSIGLHCRLVGQPGRFEGLKRFVDYIQGFDKVWVAKRIDIARHWADHHPYQPPQLAPSQMDAESFMAIFGGVFEHSPFIAQRAWEAELGPANDSPLGIHFALRNQFRMASDDERLGILNAHPDLAGKLAAAKRLTADSTSEQASAGLDALTDDERETFTELNTRYVEKFGFPFIIAVRDNTKASILEAFKNRLQNDRATEFATACAQVERIAQLRIEALYAG
ncbi:allantoinase PuuE [Pelagibacterium halotolerans]|uniref:Chitooligosaccharide deacetylase n=1 Tax=Pelagibacterium halotolerans (strain DSM 22347 / JCM 15775 / CGMCC 1.7692 / B2) TaxID=1082931 RepID=G4R6T4_PELHB|nr:allantoinase PuuE [Pelagibacterium halotolerans]AEQ52248.1 chitooligosaccharide deacetylase, putative uricase [Pelagibacterium halotolerans B2]QJR18001.1 allantoinase PuuE [Pelagibacterium halotolerans]SEA94503.1 OHCU decarboxylase [Pelagibacterium halotolerans]